MNNTHVMLVQIEVNGGGWHGRYDCSTSEGSVIASVHGNSAPSTGTVGYGNGKLTLTSTSGDVELAMLPGPLGL